MPPVRGLHTRTPVRVFKKLLIAELQRPDHVMWGAIQHFAKVTVRSKSGRQRLAYRSKKRNGGL